MRKEQELRDANSCLNKAEAEEPLFVLRAQDFSSAKTVLEWIRLNFDTAPGAKLLQAFTTALDMKKWGSKKTAD